MNKNFWKDAATAGLIMGVSLSVLELFSWIKGMPKAASEVILPLVNIMVLIWGISYFVRQRSAKFVEEGFNFNSIICYVAAFMMLSGVFQGVTSFIVMNYISPDLATESINTLLSLQKDSDASVNEDILKEAQIQMKNPLFVVLSTMFGAWLQGCILGLFVAPFTKRPPMVKSEEEDSKEDNNAE